MMKNICIKSWKQILEITLLHQIAPKKVSKTKKAIFSKIRPKAEAYNSFTKSVIQKLSSLYCFCSVKKQKFNNR